MHDLPLRITVITVCFNAAKTLARSIASVSRQTYPHVEHILIDGGSRDGTMDIVNKSYKHFSKVVSENDRGIYDAMNKGLALATGDVIVFLNADDYYADDNVLKHVASIMETQQLDVLMGNVAFFREGNEERIVRTCDTKHFHPRKMQYGWMPAHPALFIRRKILEGVGGFNVSYKIAGDFEFILRIFFNQMIKFGHLARVLVKMQIGGISTAGLRSHWIINKEILRACRENGIKSNFFKLLLRYPKKIIEISFF